MVVACSRFLCYFCRTSRHNQKAMFEHLPFLLDNATMLLARPSLRGKYSFLFLTFIDSTQSVRRIFFSYHKLQFLFFANYRFGTTRYCLFEFYGQQ